MKLKALILMCLLSTSAFAFEPPADQDCVEVQRECEPDAKQLDSNKWWYLAADCSVRVVVTKFGPSVVTDMKPEPKYECTPKPKSIFAGREESALSLGTL